MEIEDIPKEEQEWIVHLHHGSLSVQNEVYDAVSNSDDITELKSTIITYMSELMTECAQVIQHANAMKDDRICTCGGKCGDKP